MSNFIKALSMLLQDREVIKLDLKKIKDDLVLTVIPTKGKIHNITVPHEELQDPDIDAKIMGLIHTPSEKANFQHTTTEAPEREEEEEEKENEPAGKSTPKAAKNKAGKKPTAKPEKAQDKKAGKKPGPKPKVQNESPGDAQHQKELLDMLQEDSTEQNSAQSETKAPDPETKGEESETKPVESEIPVPEKEPDPGASDGDLLGKFIENGQRFFAERKYSEAEAAWQCALDMDPENEVVKTGLKKAQQWVKALSNIK